MARSLAGSSAFNSAGEIRISLGIYVEIVNSGAGHAEVLGLGRKAMAIKGSCYCTENCARYALIGLRLKRQGGAGMVGTLPGGPKFVTSAASHSLGQNSPGS